MPSKKIKNVFISHVHEDDAKLQKLKDLLAKEGYEIRDASIDSSKPNRAKDPDYIKNEILAPGIKWAGVLITLISPKTHESKWVNWEVEYAAKNDTRVVGVWAHGATDADVRSSTRLGAIANVVFPSPCVIGNSNRSPGARDWQSRTATAATRLRAEPSDASPHRTTPQAAPGLHRSVTGKGGLVFRRPGPPVPHASHDADQTYAPIGPLHRHPSAGAIRCNPGGQR